MISGKQVCLTDCPDFETCSITCGNNSKIVSDIKCECNEGFKFEKDSYDSCEIKCEKNTKKID